MNMFHNARLVGIQILNLNFILSKDRFQGMEYNRMFLTKHQMWSHLIIDDIHSLVLLCAAAH